MVETFRRSCDEPVIDQVELRVGLTLDVDHFVRAGMGDIEADMDDNRALCGIALGMLIGGGMWLTGWAAVWWALW